MQPLGWKWAAFVWGYAIIWALASDRIKLLAYRVLDPTPNSARLDAGTPSTEHDPANSSSSAKVALTTKVAAFYTDTDPGDPVYHDNDDCPYGIEIKTHHNDYPGTDHRRQCDWCARHD